MRRLLVRYRVKPEQAELNARLVRDVYDELDRLQPDGFHYATFVLDDGVGFVHLAVQEGDVNPLAAVEAFARFQEGIRDRCDEPPVATELHAVGSYRFEALA